MKTANEVIQDWIQSAAARKVKLDSRILTIEECDLIVEVLQCVAGDIAIATEKPHVTACGTLAQQ